MTFECVVSADLFRRAQLARSKGETRYYLNGVHIEPCAEGGALLVATDGRRLIALRDPHAHVTESAVVSLTNDMSKALNARAFRLPGWNGPLTGSGEAKRYVAVRGQKAAVIETRVAKGGALDPAELLEMADNPGPLVGAYQWSNSLIDGKFPDWRVVVKDGPDFTRSVAARINAELLVPVAQALTRGRMATICMFPIKDGTDKDTLFVFPANDRIDGFGLLMPVRGHEEWSMPSWGVSQ